ncbi:FecR family protein [Pedobacter nyackensis]|uniref:FecR family protein n=1 Tax=Pedobacter nyackensis TaxID=475255 RepID=A0A1W2E115_9SPHI|nr:FecR domain-containing protein [Pedobacter nyackensis]SMD02916.1 FecR family protein [Pedobacter nyackensis]
MQSTKVKELLNRYLSGDCNEEEKALVETWYLKHEVANPKILSEEEYDTDVRIIQDTLDYKPGRTTLWTRISIAALILFTLSATFYFYYEGKQDQQYVHKDQTDIGPGTDKATLTLSDGSKISLTDVENGEIATQSGLKVAKTASGQIDYTVLPNNKEVKSSRIIEYNTITTPRGGKYQILLPDGTTVWLDAASSLKYPVQFAANERNVELVGQAYFDVAKDKNKPFKVRSGKQQIEVFGTQFNVNAYSNQAAILTTLLEGSVSVSLNGSKTGKMLKPGQQAALEDQHFQINEADVEEVIAWKNGYFAFEKDDVRTVLNKLERWYDVDIISDHSFGQMKIGGTISRSKSLLEVLRVLQLTRKIKFKAEGRRIVAMP